MNDLITYPCTACEGHGTQMATAMTPSGMAGDVIDDCGACNGSGIEYAITEKELMDNETESK